MVGSLLVGRQIVDRAKIQRIIFEFDYYEKAFHQFYDTYRSLPGNLDIKNCNKYAIFRNHPNYGNICGTNYESGYGMGVRGYVNARVMKGEISHRSYNNVINALEFAGLIERTYRDPNDAGIVSAKTHFSSWDHIAAVPTNERINPYWIRYLYATTTFDPECFFYFHATHLRDQTLTMDGRKKMTFAGSSTIANQSLPHEFDNERFRQLMDEKNVLALLKEPYTAAKRSGSMAGDSNVTPIRGVTGALNSKLASELDAKLDDGRPGSGMILAMKSGSAHLADSTEKDHLENCYDKMANEVDKAIYNSSTDQKYGCNLIKILSDVK